MQLLHHAIPHSFYDLCVGIHVEASAGGAVCARSLRLLLVLIRDSYSRLPPRDIWLAGGVGFEPTRRVTPP